jgi:hypothetical protein
LTAPARFGENLQLFRFLLGKKENCLNSNLLNMFCKSIVAIRCQSSTPAHFRNVGKRREDEKGGSTAQEPQVEGIGAEVATRRIPASRESGRILMNPDTKSNTKVNKKLKKKYVTGQVCRILIW